MFILAQSLEKASAEIQSQVLLEGSAKIQRRLEDYFNSNSIILEYEPLQYPLHEATQKI